MPVQTRSGGDKPPARVIYTSAPPAPKQQRFPPRRRQIKTYGRPRTVHQMQQGTLTQMNFVAPEDGLIDLDDEDDEDDVGGIDVGIEETKKPESKSKPKSKPKSKSKPAKDNRRKTMGDELELVEKPSSSSRGNKRRKTMGDTPSLPSSSSYHTQTLTQFLSNKDGDEENWQINDSEAEEDASLVMETPKKAKEGQPSSSSALKTADPRLSGTESDQGPGLQLSKPATPSNRQKRTEIPSSESPATTPMLMRYSPPGSWKSPLNGKSMNAEAASPILRSIHKRPRDMVIQDTYSTTHSSSIAGTPTPKATVKFNTPKRLRFELPEDKENITPGRTKPKSPKPVRKTPARQPLREVPDSDAEDEESQNVANFDPDLSAELGESDSTDVLPESPTPMGNIEEAESYYGFLGDETQAEVLSSDHLQDRDIDTGTTASKSMLDDDVTEAPAKPTADQPELDDRAPEAHIASVVEQSPVPSPQVHTAAENSASLATQGHAFTQYTDLESQRLPLEDIHALGPQTLRSDIMMSLHPEHLSRIVDGTKNHEFRVWKIPPGVSRVWLYATKPTSELRYMCVFGPPKEPGQVEDEKGAGNKAFNQGKTVNKYAYEVLQVYELNDPVSLQEMIRKGWIKGAPQKYNYVPPAVVGELTANLRCALFGEDEAETPRREGSNLHVTESQEIRAQLQSDAAYSTQHHSPDHAEEVIPSSQGIEESSSKRPSIDNEARGFARPALPKASLSGAGAMGAPQTQGLSSGHHASQRQQQQNSIIRASQATTVTQMSSSPAASPEKTSSLRHRGRSQNQDPTATTLSSEASPEEQLPLPLPLPHSSSPAPTGRRRSGRNHQQNSLRSSQFLTRSQMLPDSLLNDETREPPPIIWDSADERSD